MVRVPQNVGELSFAFPILLNLLLTPSLSSQAPTLQLSFWLFPAHFLHSFRLWFWLGEDQHPRMLVWPPKLGTTWQNSECTLGTDAQDSHCWVFNQVFQSNLWCLAFEPYKTYTFCQLEDWRRLTESFLTSRWIPDQESSIFRAWALLSL